MMKKKEKMTKPKPATQTFLLSDTPAGSLLLEANDSGLCGVSFTKRGTAPAAVLDQHMRSGGLVSQYLQSAAHQLRDYFDGRLKVFDVPLDLSALPAFTRAVLEEARGIGWGKVVTYGELAAAMGKPKSARAVGGALGRNPISIIIPCHRVLAHGGYLHGYSAQGGLAVKALLLQLEGQQVENDRVI